MSKDDVKHLSLRISKDLHSKLKMKLFQDQETFQDWAEQQIKDYVDWEENQD